MITEYKVSEKYGKYMLNILVKMDSTEAQVFVAGIEVEDGVYDILEDGDKAIATFAIPLGSEKPMAVREAFAAWLEKNGTEGLDAAILGEELVVIPKLEEPVAKPAPKAKAKAKPKKVVEELPADSDGIEKD